MFPPDVTVTVSIFHLPTTGGAIQSYPVSADVTTSGASLPLDRKENALAGIDLVDPREIYIDSTVDVRLNDKVTLSSESGNFYVAHIFKAAFGGLPHQRVTLSKGA